MSRHLGFWELNKQVAVLTVKPRAHWLVKLAQGILLTLRMTTISKKFFIELLLLYNLYKSINVESLPYNTEGLEVHRVQAWLSFSDTSTKSLRNHSYRPMVAIRKNAGLGFLLR